MPRKAILLLFTVIATGALMTAQTLRAADDANWPFKLLPKPGSQIIIVPPPVNVVPPPPPSPSESDGDDHLADLPSVEKIPAGDYTATTDLTIKLNDATGKSFRLSGEVWLDGPSPRLRYPADEPAGFGLFLREVDGLHRYEANSGRVRAKRRLYNGVQETKIIDVATLPKSPLRTWLSFSVVADASRITFIFGGNVREIQGPLNTDGINEIALVAGSKLRNLQLKILDDAQNGSAWGNTP